MEIILYSLISVIIVSLISLLGFLFFKFKTKTLSKITHFLISFAVGSLFGDAFIHLIPESYEFFGDSIINPLMVIVGILLFFILEKFLRWHHCHDIDCSHHHPVVVTSLVGDAIHNFIDGLLIGATYLVSIPLGITTTIAIIVHEIPHEIADLGIYLHKGVSRVKALKLNFISASTAILGTIIALILGQQVESFSNYLIPLTAGSFLYIALSDLIPELHQDTSPKSSFIQFIAISLGIVLMFSLIYLE